MYRMAVLRNRPPDDTFSLKERLGSRKVGGVLLLLAALLAFIFANSPLEPSYTAVKNFNLPIPFLGIGDMPIARWASDGILAIFFFVVGLELKREFVTGQLRDPRKAALPIAAAVGGMAAPAAVYAIVVATSGVDAMQGWAVPVATDIAFALSVLAVFGKGLPSPFRVFLLTLAVMDDLLGILVIAIFFTQHLNFWWLLAAIAAIVVYALVVNSGNNLAVVLIPLGVLAWYFMLCSGVHATIAGVLLGLVVPALPKRGQEISFAEDMEHDWNALSQGFALPVFAFFAAGVPVAVGSGTMLDALQHPVFLGTFLGLLIGKPIGIFFTVLLLHRLPMFKLDNNMHLADVAALGGLAGIGFTVSLLIGELAFRSQEQFTDYAHLGVLFGSIAAAAIAAVTLRLRAKAAVNEQLNEDEAFLP